MPTKFALQAKNYLAIAHLSGLKTPPTKSNPSVK